MKKLSELTFGLEGQKMFQILAKAQGLERAGRQIVHFEIGDPQFDTPKNIVDAAVSALRSGKTHYTCSSGLFELRVAAAEATEKSRGFKPELSQLLVTPGANYQLRLVIGCSIEPGEEVIVPDPGFVSYASLIKNAKAIPVSAPLYEKNNFRLNPDDVEKAITDKTRMIIINSPNNPTGAVMTADEIKRMYEIAKEKDLWLVSDEVYARTIYGDFKEKFCSPSKYDFCKERTIIVNGFSKAYAMTGWRLGVVTGPSELIEKMTLLLESELSCVSPFVQLAGIEALRGSQELKFEMRDAYRKRKEVAVEGLNSLPGIRCVHPEGAFYAFPNITQTGFGSEEFADFMLREADVALCPGNFFGKYGEGYARICFATSVENIELGIGRMRKALEERV